MTTSTYDVLGRPLVVTQSDDVTTPTITYTTTWAYAWPDITITDDNNVDTIQALDGKGRLASVDTANGAGVGADFLGVHSNAGFTQDVQWREIYNNTGASFLLGQYQYVDEHGGVWKIDDDQSGLRAWLSNEAGNNYCEYDSNGDYTITQYDYANRPQSVTFDSSCTTSATASYSWFYDGATITGTIGWTYTNVEGRLSGLRDPVGYENYSYDAMGRVSQSRRKWHSGPLIGLFYAYDNEGNEVETLLTDGSETVLTCRTFGPGGRLETMKINIGTTGGTPSCADFGLTWLNILDKATYHPNGIPAVLDYSNGTEQHTLLDAFGRPEEIYSSNVTLGGVGANLDLTYTYDGLGNVTQLVDAYGSTTYDFVYDEVNRLTEVDNGSCAIQYVYDDAGNVEERIDGCSLGIDFSGSDARTFVANHDTTGDVTYDAAGNIASLTFDGTIYSLTHDPRGQLSDITDGTDSVFYDYDAQGRLVQKAYDIGGAVKTYYYVYEGDRLLARYVRPTLTGVVKLDVVYFYLGGRPIAFVNRTSGGTFQRNWIHADLQGTTRTITNSSGQRIYSQELAPFGELWSSSGAAPLASSALFAGHESFDVFGVADYGARSALVNLPGFTTPDRAFYGDPANPQTFNRYAYGLQNPMVYVDPNGEWAIPAALVVLWGITDFALTAVDTAVTGYVLVSPEFSAEEKRSTAFWYAAGAATPIAGMAAWKHLKKGVKALRGAGKGVKELPTLDLKGKVHGDLPKSQDLKNYEVEDLQRLRDDLRQSVEERIRKNSELGPQGGHGR